MNKARIFKFLSLLGAVATGVTIYVAGDKATGIGVILAAFGSASAVTGDSPAK